MENLERVLKALANRRRLAIVKHLDNVGFASVSDISQEIKLSFAATSRHMRVLYSADLVEHTQIGLTVLYKLVKPQTSLLKAVLAIC